VNVVVDVVLARARKRRAGALRRGSAGLPRRVAATHLRNEEVWSARRVPACGSLCA
jgi:hypothetical protein